MYAITQQSPNRLPSTVEPGDNVPRLCKVLRQAEAAGGDLVHLRPRGGPPQSPRHPASRHHPLYRATRYLHSHHLIGIEPLGHRVARMATTTLWYQKDACSSGINQR